MFYVLLMIFFNPILCSNVVHVSTSNRWPREEKEFLYKKGTWELFKQLTHKCLGGPKW